MSCQHGGLFPTVATDIGCRRSVGPRQFFGDPWPKEPTSKDIQSTPDVLVTHIIAVGNFPGATQRIGTGSPQATTKGRTFYEGLSLHPIKTVQPNTVDSFILPAEGCTNPKTVLEQTRSPHTQNIPNLPLEPEVVVSQGTLRITADFIQHLEPSPYTIRLSNLKLRFS